MHVPLLHSMLSPKMAAGQRGLQFTSGTQLCQGELGYKQPQSAGWDHVTQWTRASAIFNFTLMFVIFYWFFKKNSFNTVKMPEQPGICLRLSVWFRCRDSRSVPRGITSPMITCTTLLDVCWVPTASGQPPRGSNSGQIGTVNGKLV